MTPQTFIQRWRGADGSERANYQSFFNDLCELLDVDKPDPARADTRDNAYVHERHIKSQDGRSVGDNRYIDTYRRGGFIAEGKAFYAGSLTASDNSKLQNARAQAEAYARSLPAHEPWPALLMVINVGRFIALYAQFKDKSRAYEMFPDKQGYLIRIDDLADDAIRQRLRQLWINPQALDPELTAARVTRTVAEPLGQLARSLRSEGHGAPEIAGFLTRCLFSMFAEDVGLLPAGAFTRLLETAIAEPDERPACFVGDIGELWQKMDSGGYSVALRQTIPHFNGKLFKAPAVIALKRAQIEILHAAARQDWKHVEPAIFGTLMERSLDADERHALGAEYTPRAYVERLVLPTLIDPLRREWDTIRSDAIKAWERGQHQKAPKILRQFHHRLCTLRVLDPACGSGNFLYIALEHLKRLEAEVLEQLEAMNTTQSLESEGLTVDPHQFLGIELNPRAAAIA
ncbi:MAG: class I SAM-dependent DNA methyltransferase, partial [Rhodocyclaceae bacterium]|nr:class I SAM-dependent DNA methyltransferase [Rhodocyclaceae bacterium]